MARTSTRTSSNATKKGGTRTRRKTTAARSKSKKPDPPKGGSGLSPATKRALRYLVALGFVGFTSLSLFSYSPTDPAFSRRSTVADIANWCGRWGAVLADVLFQLVGWGAWSILLVGVWLGMRLARRPEATVLKLVAGLLATAFASTLFGLMFFPDLGGYYPKGGVFGTATAGWLLEHLGTVGSYVLVLVCVLGAATVAFGINWERLAGQGIRLAEGQAPRIRALASQGGGVARERASELAARAKEAVKQRAERRAAEPEAPEWPTYEAADEPGSLGLGHLDVAIDAPDPVFTHDEGLTGIRFDASAPMDQDRPTQLGGRSLVEVEYDPTVHDDEPPTPVQAASDVRATEPRGQAPAPDDVYNLPLASLPGRDVDESVKTPAPYVDEDEMGDGSVYIEPGTRAETTPPAVTRDSIIQPLVEEDYDAEPEPERVIRPGSKPATKMQLSAPIEPGNLVSGGGGEPEQLNLIKRPSVPDVVFEKPTLALLDAHERSVGVLDEEALKEMAANLVQKLADFKIEGEVTAIRPGPVITIFEYAPAPGIKVSRIAGLTDDIAMAMKALRVRIVAPIPGKGVVGIELPNKQRQVVWYRDLMQSKEYREKEWLLPMALGKTPEGRPYVADLAKMPHLLVGGTTGSGKSVGVNSMLMTMLYHRTPEELKLILIDPKMLEFELYNDIPHLLHPVVTEPKLAAAALKWACVEMDERYRLLARWGTRNIVNYNNKLEKETKDWTPEKALRYKPRSWPDDVPPPEPKKLPYIVIVIDELADLMMIASKEVEESIVRLAQKARACGIHLIVATQRPSVDVITGLIKANMPSRIAFQVRSKTDGRTILDQNGAETLLGKGDMLLLPPGVSALQRLHGPFVSDEEVARVCDFLKDQADPVYEAKIQVDEGNGGGEFEVEEYDENYDMAVQIVTEAGKASTSMIQRHLKIGYNRAARIVDMMEREGVVGPADGARPRKVLVGSIEP